MYIYDLTCYLLCYISLYIVNLHLWPEELENIFYTLPFINDS